MTSRRYASELTAAMKLLAEDPRVIFLGQAVAAPGTAMYQTLEHIDSRKRLEFPVAEEMQLGVSLGMALTGYVPVAIYPRWNFLLLAMNQLVNHVDKREELFRRAKGNTPIIIRTSIGSERPLHPRSQHVGDFSRAVSMMTPNCKVVVLSEPDQIVREYEKALHDSSFAASILVEHGDFHNEK